MPEGTDERLAQLLGRCFAHDQDQRPTAAQLRAELEALLTSLQSQAQASALDARSLFIACRDGRESEVEHLLKRGADVSWRDEVSI